MVLPHRCGPCLSLLRTAHTQAALESNYYKILGLSPSATQAEIKAAYFELSKKHHPDRNRGSEDSAKIFRLVKSAYEVLGNEKKRMQYDKERIFNSIRKPIQPYPLDNTEDYEYEAERIHFQSKARRPFRRYGRTTYYDFDAWYEGHYGKNGGSTYEFKRPRQFTVDYQEERTEKQQQVISKVTKTCFIVFYTLLILSGLRFTGSIGRTACIVLYFGESDNSLRG